MRISCVAALGAKAVLWKAPPQTKNLSPYAYVAGMSVCARGIRRASAHARRTRGRRRTGGRARHQLPWRACSM